MLPRGSMDKLSIGSCGSNAPTALKSIQGRGCPTFATDFRPANLCDTSLARRPQPIAFGLDLVQICAVPLHAICLKKRTMRRDEGSFEVVRSLKLNHAFREAFALSCTALFRAFEVNGIPEPHMSQTSWIPTTHIYSFLWAVALVCTYTG